jgi:tRNA1(Val) A37 N6-methylase TrmN6
MQLLENERLDDLQYKGLKLIQKKDGFCFGVDAVLLADFADVRKGDRVIDLGSGTGIISVLLSAKKNPESVVGLEIQQKMSEMASRSVEMNGIGDRVRMVCGDIKEAVKLFGASAFHAVVTNPPYMNKGGGLLNPSDTKAVSRHEILCTLSDVVTAGARLLVPGGRFSMVHRPERLADIICLMRANSLEPKFLKFVHPSPGKKPNLVLISGTRGGRPMLKVLEPLYVYDSNGSYSDEINRIYGRTGVNL